MDWYNFPLRYGRKAKETNTAICSMLRKPRSELLFNIHEKILRKTYTSKINRQKRCAYFLENCCEVFASCKMNSRTV